MFDFLQYDFMSRALTAGLLIAVLAPTIGLFIVVKRYSLLPDTLSHISLLGVASGLFLNLNPYLFSTIFAVLGSLTIEKLQEKTQLYQEAILAMFLSGSLALSIILISLNKFQLNISSLLFGSLTTVTPSDLAYIFIMGITVILFILITYKKLFFIAFDQELAKATGLHTSLYNSLLIVAAAITISISIRTIGVLLVSALLVIPVLTALRLETSFKKTHLWAICFSIISVLIGIIASYHLQISTGGSIVLTTIVLYCLVSSYFSFFKKIFAK